LVSIGAAAPLAWVALAPDTTMLIAASRGRGERPMTNLSDYVTETEAGEVVGVSVGKGNVWRHLREHAPEIELEQIFGVTAVKRADLEKYCKTKRLKVVDAFTHQKRRAQLRPAQAMFQKQQEGQDG